MNIQFTLHGKRALDNVYEWHKLQGAGMKGRQIRAAILKKTRLLQEFPLLGQKEEYLAELEQEHRYLVEGNYKIIYRTIGQVIYISDIFDTRQDPSKMKS